MKSAILPLALCLVAVVMATDKLIDGPVVGIDLGTTYSCVGIYKNGRVEIIPNEFGNRITPSYVAFTDDERLVGDAAKNQASINPTRTIYVVKRLIGRKYDDKEVQRDLKWLPYSVISKGGRPHVSVEMPVIGVKALSPEEVSAMVLGKMKEIAQNYLGRDVQHAVVTVPAYFNDSQRKATRDAGQIAGLDVIRIINEPTAAAIAYGLDKRSTEMNILVYDLGGGTFDVSVLTIDDGVFEVIATSGDTHLGGEDFDQRLAEHFTKIFKKKTGKDIRSDNRAMQKLKGEVEKAKRDLSSVHQVKITIDNILDGEDFEETITRARFEELCADLFKKTLAPVQTALDDSQLEKTEISEIVLVGGSTRIPKVQSLIQNFFSGKEPNKSINPDEAVAYGAAVQASILSGQATGEDKDLLVIDVTPLTLGVELEGGEMGEVIPRGTVIPARKSQIYSTAQDDQRSVMIKVFEGERALTQDNHNLGNFNLTDIPAAPKGTAQIEVTFIVDEDSILTVSAQEKRVGKSVTITITSDNERLTDEEIEQMVKESNDFGDQDRLSKERLLVRKELKNYIYEVRTLIESKDKLANIIAHDEKVMIDDTLLEQTAWFNSNMEAEKEDFEEHLRELEKICEPIIEKYEIIKQDIKEEVEAFEDL